jgi:hypothetical protein
VNETHGLELGIIDATQGGDDDDMSLALKKIHSEKALQKQVNARKIKKVVHF